MLHPGWKDWYHLKHLERSRAQGNAFEEYIESVLARHHPDYVNPTPAGSLGDGGCDGLAERGSILYACYGSRAARDAERKLRAKIASDFSRGLETWVTFTTWCFVTNAPTGPECLKQITELQQLHSAVSERPIVIRLWNPERLWIEVVSKLTPEQLNELFPGAPGMANVELEDLVSLLDVLQDGPRTVDEGGGIRPVPAGKVEFNSLPETSRLELNSGRTLAPRIDQWFAEGSDPALHDVQASRFRDIYVEHRRLELTPSELLERIYVAVGGSDFRLDIKRANAVYGVAAYFFDECHIFDEPPDGFTLQGLSVAIAN